MELCPAGFYCIPETVHCWIGIGLIVCIVLIAINLDQEKPKPGPKNKLKKLAEEREEAEGGKDA